ncbi:Zinc finger protein zat3 [Quillaja saponaria]|uniref:Zinc finger protein zat3 n=1 Tax=Quillaja saponaria TaxID=32244 RepID=A0AAD7PRK1_QUISA|nr:Zinc finger protein zat3 [Quillaja saponaria]
MRSHPEREWRGVVPPPSSSSMLDFSDKQNLDENFISSGMDLSKSLPSWQKTDKRGRKSIGVAEAAQNLISLSQMNWSKGEYCMKKSNKKKKKMKIKKKKKILKTKSQNTESEDTALLIKTLIKSLPGAYKCGICSKSFTTFQALGGHRSSHNKDKNRINRDAEIGQDQNEFISGSMMEETHYIRHCSPSEVSQSGPEQGLSAEASDQVFAFDLNEPLVMENGGVEDGGVDSAFSQA